MKIKCIATGSSGNCFYCESESGTGVFLDAGAPPESILDQGLSIANKPFFITHEHGDHAKYADELHSKYGATMIATPGTLKALNMLPQKIKANHDAPLIAIGDINELKGIEFSRINVIHNAKEPCAFLINMDGESLLYIVDAGQIPEVKHLRPQVLIIEANYTQECMEENAKRSDSGLYVSGRVSSGFGHLSVNQAVEAAMPMFPTLELLIFTHMSGNNFDLIEYFKDDSIPKAIKDKAMFAEAGKAYSTVPF